MSKILEVNNLTVDFNTPAGKLQAVRGVSFSLYKGEALAVVGESGCGKTVTAQSIMGLISPGDITEGDIIFNGVNLVKAQENQMESIRGREIGMVFQDPMTALDPTMKVGHQIEEVLIKHRKMSVQQARDRSLQLLEMAGISNPEFRLKQYPHQLSGGLRQRVLLAIALACNPQLLIADEPTTALDVTIQAQIMELVKELQAKLGMSIILITHDLGTVAGLCSRIVVMYAGQIVEGGPVKAIFSEPGHPYTRGLLRSVPRLDTNHNVPLSTISGTPPDLLAPPQGCTFWPRCHAAMKICTVEIPPNSEIGTGHFSRCWLNVRPKSQEVS